MKKEDDKEDEPLAPEEQEEDDVYGVEEVEKELEDDELSKGEAGFMEGYDKDRNKDKQKHK